MFKIPAYERSVVWLQFTFSLVIATSYVVARTIGDSLFLSRVGNDQLALVFVLSGVGTAIVAASWYLLTNKFTVATAIKISSCVFAILGVLALFLLPNFHHSFWLLASIYLLADIKGCINAINIVSALNTKLGRDASKSSWALVGLAAPMAAVLMGSVLAVESSAIGIQTWLLFGILLDIVAFTLGYSLSKSQSIKNLISSGKANADHQPAIDVSEDFRIPGLAKRKTYVCSEQFRRWIGILIAAKVIVLTIVAFEWKSSVNTFFEGQTESLVRFFGIYYGIVGLATIAIQLFATSKFLHQKNVALPILMMPISLLLVSVAIICSPVVFAVLIFATLGKSLDAWRRSVHDTTLNFLYTRIRRGKRRFAISINSGLVKPLAEVAAACAIFLGSAFLYRTVLMVVLMIWILAAWKLIRLVKPSKSSSKATYPAASASSKPLIQT